MTLFKITLDYNFDIIKPGQNLFDATSDTSLCMNKNMSQLRNPYDDGILVK